MHTWTEVCTRSTLTTVDLTGVLQVWYMVELQHQGWEHWKESRLLGYPARKGNRLIHKWKTLGFPGEPESTSQNIYKLRFNVEIKAFWTSCVLLKIFLPNTALNFLGLLLRLKITVCNEKILGITGFS